LDTADLLLHLVTKGYLVTVTAIIANTGASAVTSVMDGIASSGSVANDVPRHRWFPLGESLATAGFRNPFGDPPFAVTSKSVDAIGGFNEDLHLCAHLFLLSKLALAGFRVEVSLDPVIRKSEAYPARLQTLSWTQIALERMKPFQVFQDHVIDNSLDALLSVRDWEPDRAPTMPDYCLFVVPEMSSEVLAQQADRSDSRPSALRRLLIWKSHEQFSTHQGSMGWSYGYRRKKSGDRTDEGFATFSHVRRVTTPEGLVRVEHWREAKRFPRQLAVSASTQHPAIALRLTDQSSKHVFLAIRKWESNFVGNLSIRGWLSRTANCGDGVQFRLLVAGENKANRTMLPSENPLRIEVNVEVNVVVGTTVELQLDPLADDECDLTDVDFSFQGRPDLGLQ